MELSPGIVFLLIPLGALLFVHGLIKAITLKINQEKESVGLYSFIAISGFSIAGYAVGLLASLK